MTEVFVKQAKKSEKGVTYAPGKGANGKYMIFKLCNNYDGQVKGGVRKTWRYVAKDLTLEQAKIEFVRLLGRDIYSEKK